MIVALSGSVALLGDTIHNAADALTAVPLGVAFVIGRRPATRRYTYGYGRAEDLAGIVIVLAIAASAGWPPTRRSTGCCIPARSPTCGRWRWPRWPGSSAMSGWPGTASGPAARSGRPRWSPTGCTRVPTGSPRSRCCWARAASRRAGAAADPVVGLLITAAILVVLRDAAREVYRRLMDAVDPALVGQAEAALAAVDGVRGVGPVRMRWIGHALRAEADIVVDAQLTVVQAHELAVAAEHALIHAVPRLTAATVHTDHLTAPGLHDPHAPLAHHAPDG